MASESAQDRDLARAALDSVADDRRTIGRRLTAQTWWSAPAQGLAAGVMILAPLAGVAGPMAIVLALSSLAFFGIDWLARKRTQVTVRNYVGPASLVILIAMCVVIVAAIATSIVLEITGQREWIVAVAAATAVIVGVGSAAYDHVYAKELLRGR